MYLNKLQFLSTEHRARQTKEMQWNAPELRVEVKSADTSGKETAEVYLGKVEQDNVWLMKEGAEWAYAFPVESIQELSDQAKEQPKSN